MAVRMVGMGKIADGVIRKLQYEPDSYTLSGRDRETLADSINEALAELYSDHTWPQLRRCELRTYRAPHSMTETYAAGDEVWLANAAEDGGGDYWRALSANTGVPPADGSAAWERIPEDELLKFIEFEQPWESWAIDEGGYDLTDFAFEEDPRYTPNLEPIKGCAVGDFMDSVTLPEEAPKRVYIKFIPRRPKADFTEWAAATDYVAGDTCYLTLTRQTYLALRESLNKSPDESPDDWAEVGVPEIFARYLKLRAVADWKTEDDGRDRAKAEADAELGRLANATISRRNIRQGGYDCGR